ncbi:hypothetical protein PHMEG_0008586 [Phytophthora megakarya]|uniref:SWIM-type domain-containing protein n=1 Tax=Phytophthora megakarya TaxID=4795 RepID=A0A225WIM3_9STRA|nr:hypothetical protein PHMEG_0008586 [Phytophthora megakarya]
MELDESEMECAAKFNVIGACRYHGADKVLLHLATLVSSYAFDIIRKEYDLFRSGEVAYSGGWLQAGIVELESDRTQCEYTVDTSTFVCSCVFMRTLLPCHHTMYVRAELKKKKIIPLN